MVVAGGDVVPGVDSVGEVCLLVENRVSTLRDSEKDAERLMLPNVPGVEDLTLLIRCNRRWVVPRATARLYAVLFRSVTVFVFFNLRKADRGMVCIEICVRGEIYVRECWRRVWAPPIAGVGGRTPSYDRVAPACLLLVRVGGFKLV